MLNIIKVNYNFPNFGLEITHDQSYVIRAEFVPYNDDGIKIQGAKTELGSEIIRQLDCYVQNPKYKFKLPLNYNGSSHQQKVWQLMLEIESGETLSYGLAAKMLGSASRAIGGACGKNPLPVFIPCHRIIAANNKLGGFNSGNIFFSLGIKKWLLEHEGVILNIN